MLKKIFLKSMFFVLPFAVNSCATMFSGTTQSIQVTPYNKNNNISIAENITCILKNNQGQWVMSAPNTVTVHRGGGTLFVNCKSNDGKLVGNTTIASDYNFVDLWNVGLLFLYIVPGVIGFAVDGTSGAIAKYNDNVSIMMN